MPNPTIDPMIAETSNALERWYDRWTAAFTTARNGFYGFEQFAADVAETWADSTYVSLLPIAAFGAVAVTKQPVFPVVRFVLLNKNDVSRIVAVPNLASVTSMASENLQDAAGDQIPNTNVTLAKTGPTLGFIKVSLSNLGTITPTPPAGFYSGNIIGQPMNAPIARIEVVFP